MRLELKLKIEGSYLRCKKYSVVVIHDVMKLIQRDCQQVSLVRGYSSITHHSRNRHIRWFIKSTTIL